jgi:histidinol-phosphatase (PHP family)
VLDYHVHLWPHGTRDHPPTVDELARYCDRAAARGVGQIALTEHLFRFARARAAVGEFWAGDGADRHLAGVMQAYWEEHAHADLDVYVQAVLDAKAAGLPVLLGLEVDHYPGRMDAVARFLSGYPFDVLLGSVHWIGRWLFDWLDDPTSAAEWGRRGIDAVWDAYTSCLEELAGSGTCDVLAHPDLIKITGRRPGPGPSGEFHARMAEAASAGGMAAEVSSAGWRKPVGEAYPAPDLLTRLHAAGVPVTLASDTHGVGEVAFRSSELVGMVRGAGYAELAGYSGRRRHPVPLPE